jgi:hypothetical protein
VVTSSESLRNVTTEFPVVTLCNLNFFVTKSGQEYLNNLENEFANSDVYKNMPRDSKSKTKLIQLRLKYAKSALYKNQTLWKNVSWIRTFGYELKDMMLSCYFGSEPCNDTEFEYFFDINYGNCYKYNSGLNSSNKSTSILSVISSGDTTGLQLGLYVGTINLTDKITYSSGIYLAIHNKSFKSLLPTNGFNIPTGRATNIGKNILNIFTRF